MHILFFIFLVLCLLGLAIRTGYELLKKAGRLDPKNKVVFGVVFAGMILLLTSWIFMCPADPWRITLPGFIRGMGLGVLILGIAIAVTALIQLRGVENIDHLVTTGMFSKLRHPMYLGFILWIAGWIIFTGAGASLLVGMVAVVCILFWRRLEEEKLLADYGEEYRMYRKETWF
jgi:protein-S-isoprenylcysteine O-methyltransferase Ste14